MSGRDAWELRLGCVRYLNTLPLIEGLEKTSGVVLMPAAPSALAGMLARGEVDVALLSLIDCQRCAEEVALIPSGVIGCDGRTLTVRLYCAGPLERLTRVHADTESHTAVMLMRVALRRLYGATPEVVPFDASNHAARGAGRGDHARDAVRPEALLLIGDKVVVDAPDSAAYPNQLDLGEAWKRMTGMGFTYAAWACLRRDAGSERVRRAWELLDRQRRHNATRLEWIAERRAGEREWPVDTAREYLGGLLRYDAGGPESARRGSIERFFDCCAEDGLIMRRPTVWLDEAMEPCPA